MLWKSPGVNPELRRVFILSGAIVMVLAGGTLGYMILEGWSFTESLYMTVITLSTVGFKEIRTPSTPGRMFTILLIMGGVGIIAYGLTVLMDFVVSGQLSGIYRRRLMRKEINGLDGHYILCGYGRVGEAVTREFATEGVPFVVVDSNPESVQKVQEQGFLVVGGDASDDDVLTEAGIGRARGLVAAVDSDADNIFVTLSARVLNPQLIIVARANTEDSLKKLRKAGANQVISPYSIGGKKMASLMLKPLVSDYLDVVTGGGEIEFRLEEFTLNETCDVVGKTIGDLEIRRKTGATILAVRHGETGMFDTNPSPDLALQDGDILIAIGTPQNIANLEELFACSVPPLRQEGYGKAE